MVYQENNKYDYTMRYLLIFFTCINVFYPRSKSIAICTEMKGQVLREGVVRSGQMRKGDPVYDGDKIILNENGFLSFFLINLCLYFFLVIPDYWKLSYFNINPVI